MVDQENLADFWKEQLFTSEKPAETLQQMYKSLVTSEGNYIVTFRKLVKIYGRKSVYFSILDCADMNQVDGDPLRIISYFAKKRLDTKSNPSDIISIEEIEKKINKLTKGKIGQL